MIQPSSLFVVDADARSLETLTFGFEREGCKVTGTSDLKRAGLLVRSAGAEVAVVSLREPEPSSLDVVSELREIAKDLPIVVLGPQGSKADALRAGAADFLTLPTYLRDVIGVGKLTVLGSKAGQRARTLEGCERAADAPLGALRPLLPAARHGVVRALGNPLAHPRQPAGRAADPRRDGRLGQRRGDARAPRASSPACCGKRRPLRSPAGSSPSAASCTCRHRRSSTSASGSCATSPTRLATSARRARSMQRPPNRSAELRGLQPSQVTPLLRLFDGRRVLADVIEESPFRIFDTVRMIRRLRDAGLLVVRPDEPTPERRDTRTGAGPELARKNGTSKSMLAEWAMVPDQRGVVGDRRTTSRRLRPLEAKAPAPAPIPLTTKKGASATGEIAAAKRRPTPAAASASLLAVAPTVQVQLDASGVPVGEPLVPSDPSSFPSQRTPPPVRTRDSSGRFAPLEDAPPARRSEPTPLALRARSGSGRRPSLEEACRSPEPSQRPKRGQQNREQNRGPRHGPNRRPSRGPTRGPSRRRCPSGPAAAVGACPPLEDGPPPRSRADAPPTKDQQRRTDPRPGRVRRARVRLLRPRSGSLQARGARDVRRSRSGRRHARPPAPQK